MLIRAELYRKEDLEDRVENLSFIPLKSLKLQCCHVEPVPVRLDQITMVCDDGNIHLIE